MAHDTSCSAEIETKSKMWSSGHIILMMTYAAFTLYQFKTAIPETETT